jgi:hypothetical protein
MSSIRIIKNYSKHLKLKVKFIEAEDGIECLYIFHELLKKGLKISAIISD